MDPCLPGEILSCGSLSLDNLGPLVTFLVIQFTNLGHPAGTRSNIFIFWEQMLFPRKRGITYSLFFVFRVFIFFKNLTSGGVLFCGTQKLTYFHGRKRKYLYSISLRVWGCSTFSQKLQCQLFRNFAWVIHMVRCS